MKPGRAASERSGKAGAIGRPLAVLTLCVLVAGGGLAWFTVRAAMQERTIAEQEAREATSTAARLVADAIVPQLETLERRVPGAGGGDRDAGDDRVILTLRAGRAIPTKPPRLLFDLQSPAAGDEVAWPAASTRPSRSNCALATSRGRSPRTGNCSRAAPPS